MLVDGLSNILMALTDNETYAKQPPSGPPTSYPVLTESELSNLTKDVFGKMLGHKSAYQSIQIIGDPDPVNVAMPDVRSLDGKYLWGIDGSSSTLDFTAFSLLLSRAAIVQFGYSDTIKDSYHIVDTIDNGAVCIVDGNIFSHHINLVGIDGDKFQTRESTSWIDIIDKATEPIIVSYDPSSYIKNPSRHATGWNNKFMQTLELSAHNKIPSELVGVVIRDGPLFPIYATNNDIKKSMETVLNWDNKLLICSSKRVSESTIFLELLSNQNMEPLRNYFFPEQTISEKILKKMPSDHLLLRKILKPGQRTPFIKAIPYNRIKLTQENPDLEPICCYYMRSRKPHSIIRLEFPRKFLLDESLEWGIQCVAWQHELGTRIPQIQEFADEQCQVSSEAEILRKITASQLLINGLETIEVYE